MIISEYAEKLRQKIRDLKPGAATIGELAHHLDLHDFQLLELAGEGVIAAESHGQNARIGAEAVRALQENPGPVVDNLSLSTIELQKILNMSPDAVGAMISNQVITPYKKRKRKGHLRSIFRLSHLIEVEGDIVHHAEMHWMKSETHRNSVIDKYKNKEQELLSRSVATAERPLPPPVADSRELATHAGHVKEVAAARAFVLDPWQIEAIQALEGGNHVFVQAPTGAGKTAIVEEFLRRNTDSGIKLFYAVPIKALANDKFFDFCDLYGRAKVGINTGDITVNPDAPIVVGTTEIVRNILFNRPDAYNVLAFDEAQYLGDEERGGAWEESIIMCSPSTLMIFLSGSVANGDDIAKWVEKIKERKVRVFKESVRPIPLKFAFPYGDGFIGEEDWDHLNDLAMKTQRPHYANLAEFILAAEKARMLPMLLFMPRRRDCEEAFANVNDIPAEQSRELEKQLMQHPEIGFLNLKVRQLIIRKGCSYHHSGLLPPEKRIVETLAKQGRLRVVAATMSLASGVNFSVRSCLISEYARPGNSGNMQALKPSEILQMWGRAGRRRLDVEGYVIPCSNIENVKEFRKIKAYPEPIIRDKFVSPVNLLSILNRHSTEVLEELCAKSLSSHANNMTYRLFSDATMFREAGSICESPTYELPPYRQAVYKHVKKNRLEEDYRCGTCSNLKKCTATYENKIKNNPLQQMVKHLKVNGYLSESFIPTLKGKIAERFHSEIGLLVSHHLMAGKVTPANLVSYAATVSSPGHIDFLGTRKRLFLDCARQVFPPNLFPTLWERHRGKTAFIYWNPGAGAIAKRWIESGDWESFSNNEQIKPILGDVFRVLLRTGELLRSMTFLREFNPAIAEAAEVAIRLLMRPPLVPENLFGAEI